VGSLTLVAAQQIVHSLIARWAPAINPGEWIRPIRRGLAEAVKPVLLFANAKPQTCLFCLSDGLIFADEVGERKPMLPQSC